MKVGSLVKNNSSNRIGLVVGFGNDRTTVHIHWIRSNIINTWNKFSQNLEVICE